MGSRMNMEHFPKQYMTVGGRPMISYCLRTFNAHSGIDRIVIVADEAWHDFILACIAKEQIHKFGGFAAPGKTRQLSVLNGLKAMEETAAANDLVIIHDAARPLVPEALITDCLTHNARADGVMPVLPVKDTCYESTDGAHISRLLKRSTLFAGQAPESFRFGSYLAAHQKLSEEELEKISGSSELAYLSGLTVEMIPGAEINFKVTTKEDLQLFASCLEEIG